MRQQVVLAITVLDGRSTNRGAQGQRKKRCFTHTNIRGKVEIQGLHHRLLVSPFFLLLLPHPSVPLWDALEEKGFFLVAKQFGLAPHHRLPCPP